MSQSNTTNTSRHQVYIYITVVAIMCTVFGFNLGSLISSKLRLVNIFMIGIYDIDSMLNTFLLGSFVGSFLCCRVISQTGRLHTIIGAFILGVLSHCTSSMSPTFSTLFLSEFAVGVAFGTYLLAALCYIAEIAPSSSRGRCSTLVGVFFCLGLLLAFLLRTIIVENSIIVITVILILSVPVLLYSYTRLPESPRYLSITEASDRALSVLIKLRHKNSDAARELAAINECALGEEKGIDLFFRSSVYRSVLWLLIATALLIFFQGCAIIPYMSSYLCSVYSAAIGASNPQQGYEMNLLIIGIIFAGCLCSVAISSYLSDKIGHRSLMITTCALNEILLLALFIHITLMNKQFGAQAIALILFLYSFSSVALINVFITTLVPELLPLKGREFGLSICLIICYAALMLCLYLFTRMMQGFGILTLLFFFALIGAILYFVLRFVLPEPKGQMLEQMENTIFNERSIKAIDKR